jgi:predicted nucleotidyltransferase
MAEIPDNIKKNIYDYINGLSEKIHIESAFLFGSYAKGNWRNDSDIDIAVFSDFFSDVDRTEAIAFLLDNALPYRVDIQPLAFDDKDFKNYHENPFINEIVTTGIKIV